MAGALESDLRKLLRDRTKFNEEDFVFIEHGRGGDAGLPDVMLIEGKKFVPIELKKGPSVLKKLRPTQRGFHKQMAMLMVPTFGLTLHKDQVIMFRLKVERRERLELAEKELFKVHQTRMNRNDIIRAVRSQY